jgi:hypothetical protein
MLELRRSAQLIHSRTASARQWLARLSQGKLKHVLSTRSAAILAQVPAPGPLIGRARQIWHKHGFWLGPGLQFGGPLLGLALIFYLANLDEHPPLSASRADRPLPTPMLATRPSVTLQPTVAALVLLPLRPTPAATPLPTASPAATPLPTATPAPPTATPVPPTPRPTLDLPNEPVRLRLVDKGGTPVLFDPALDALRQDPAVGTNVYQIGDVFVDPRDGREWTWGDGETFVSSVGILTLDAFRIDEADFTGASLEGAMPSAELLQYLG